LREYEVAYIVDPALSEEELSALITRFVDLAKAGGAEVAEPERWERRRLAYPLKEKREGIYIFMRIKAEKPAVTEVERVLKLTEAVLREMIVRLDED
jgi:small subunit ribosomal protein S6